MIDLLDRLHSTYYYLNLFGEQYEFQMLIVAVFALVLLLIAVVLLIAIITISGNSKSEVESEKVPAISQFKQPKLEESDRKVTIREKSKNQEYANEHGLVICPFCETFNSQRNDRCCACGQALRK